ncbi:gpi ethanolamine phosphate transferase 2 [Lecanosticta acicola]|uniref:Gpi ethanolamine phosphate transferase 2 n=1 Tax=Lecanosticta acicola TaxID=111012 RepID=A0AAI8YSJ0_9PEZI|nr:gpi ethanolamine phosphate transferase 2 [Lecanosticta acicola]
MAPVIWGLDLAEIKWSKFGNKNMWSSEYHLRRTKFIVYQCALIFCVVSESLGTAALSDYIDAQDFVKSEAIRRQFGNIYVFNNDYVGVASYNIFAGVFVAFIFGAAFFFDLFWPERYESKGVRIAWKVCGIMACIFYTADAFALTVITALRCQTFSGGVRPNSNGPSILSEFQKDGGTPICYRDNGRAIAAVVFCWPGLLSVIGSCILLFYSLKHIEKGLGAKSTHARKRDAEATGIESDGEKEKEQEAAPAQQDLQPPPQAHVHATQPADAARPAGAAPVAA